jgi:uncharacterized protein YjbI with pentapeptide repeats
MFKVVLCAAGCGRSAITGSSLCAVHVADSRRETARIVRLIKEQTCMTNLNAAGLHFENEDFSNRSFYECNFIDASFSQCIFTGTFMRLVFFDFAVFFYGNLTKSDIQFSSFAGAKFYSCTFEDSELPHLNYTGTIISDCSFNHSNLYNSRFINADLDHSNFIDCTLTHANFIGAKQNVVSFKASNTAEAVFKQE